MQVQGSKVGMANQAWRSIGLDYGNMKGRLIHVIGVMNEFLYKIYVLVKNLIPNLDEIPPSFDELCLANQDKTDTYQSAEKAYMFRLKQVSEGTYYVLQSMLNNFGPKLKENEDLIGEEIEELKACLNELKLMIDEDGEFSEQKLQASIQNLKSYVRKLFNKINAFKEKLKDKKQFINFIIKFKSVFENQMKIYRKPSSDPSLKALWVNYKNAEQALN